MIFIKQNRIIKKGMKRVQFIFSIFLMLFNWGLMSCKTTNSLVYFKNVTDTNRQAVAAFPEYHIRTGDILHISVAGNSVEDASIFNLPLANQSVGTTLSGTNLQVGNSIGYQVDSIGVIRFPLLGEISVLGLTKDEVGRLIEKQLLTKQLLVNPIVNVRLQNFRITVLGEVSKPSIFYLPNERLTLPEALGYAGDLTILGRRDNVLIIRESSGQRVFNRINLQDEKLFTSPFYYLHSNDVIYVEPINARRTATEKWRQDLPVIIGLLSFLTALFIAIRR
jgi:polysaccharide export outer membrane protein